MCIRDRDSVTFTDMDGIVNEYVVNKVEVLDPHSAGRAELAAGGDLQAGVAPLAHHRQMCIRDSSMTVTPSGCACATNFFSSSPRR